jgi:hypothetical protein
VSPVKYEQGSYSPEDVVVKPTCYKSESRGFGTHFVGSSSNRRFGEHIGSIFRVPRGDRILQLRYRRIAVTPLLH